MAGRTVKGVLGAEVADLLAALSVADPEHDVTWQKAAQRLFGVRGAGLQGAALMHVGDAQLPEDLRSLVAADISAGRLTPRDVLAIFTEIRNQTAMDVNGAPRSETLRALRVIVRGRTFEAPLTFDADPSAEELALLAACVKALRRVGVGRTRGLGNVKVTLCDADGEDITEAHFAHFRKVVTG
jgi:hypothetical protein